jgi:hypothetical protein
MTSRITGYGVGASKVALAPVPTQNNGVPTSNTAYDFGQLIQNKATGNWYLYAGAGSFPLIASSSGDIISVVGTANQIGVSTVSGVATVSISSSPSIGGTVTAATGFTATTGNLVATTGQLQLNGAASRVLINASAPSTAAVGFLTLGGGATTTLMSSAITTSSIILFSLKTLGTVMTSEITYTTTTGSATVTPGDSSDTSVYGYLIIN